MRHATRYLAAASLTAAAAALPSAAASADAPNRPTDGIQALERAHAHNDYEHDRPLLDALSHGFTSVEADVWLVDGELCIGHDAPDCSRTLQSLYLEPLADAQRAKGPWIYDDSAEPVRLYVDVKDGGYEVYEVLQDQLAQYPSLLTSWVHGRERTKAVEVVLSGQLANTTFDDRIRWAASDGRIATPIPEGATPSDITVLSENWTKLFTWNGIGEMPEQERERLHRIVQGAHADGYEVRFWATAETWPAREAVWTELIAADVDQINTDHLAELEAFLKANDPDEQG